MKFDYCFDENKNSHTRKSPSTRLLSFDPISMAPFSTVRKFLMERIFCDAP